MTGRKRPPSQRQNAKRQPAGDTHYLYGIHAVATALANPERRSHRLVATDNALQRLKEQGAPVSIDAETQSARDITRLIGPDAVHQGALLYCDPLPDLELETVLEPDSAQRRLMLVLDQITDPHNIGAILRSAAAFSADGLIMTARHAPGETAVLAKTASGGLEHVPIYRVRNLANAMEQLKTAGFQVAGLDETGSVALDTLEFAPSTALVLGAEGKGLRQKTLATCDHIARLDMPGAITSLNVSNAAALALYIASRRLIPV
ncbi:MAG: 23S rRNA (guanosine(2251)-2'-O)-methyltransferase RlmB [Pseudomonadota bacterium]